MHQTTREIVLDMIFDLRAAKIAGNKFRQFLTDDPYSRIIYKEEKQKIDIEGYVDNELMPGERNRFEKKLKENPELALETNFRGRVNQAIKDIGLVKSIQKAHDEYIRIYEAGVDQVESKESKTIKLLHNRYSRWIAAASIIILIGISASIYFSENRPIEDKLYSQYYKPLGNEIDQHFVLNSSALKEAKDQYLQKKYSDALIIFNNLPNNLDILNEKEFYIGLSLMEMDSYKEAINKFNLVINDNEYACKGQALWYLGLCYLKVNQKQKAIEIFQDIVENKSYNHDKAGKILKKIN